jgi:hypothetical protein
MPLALQVDSKKAFLPEVRQLAIRQENLVNPRRNGGRAVIALLRGDREGKDELLEVDEPVRGEGVDELHPRYAFENLLVDVHPERELKGGEGILEGKSGEDRNNPRKRVGISIVVKLVHSHFCVDLQRAKLG